MTLDDYLPKLIGAAAAFCDDAIATARSLTPDATAEALAGLTTGAASLVLQIEFTDERRASSPGRSGRANPAVRLTLIAMEADGEPVATIFDSTAVPQPDRMRH